MAITVGIFGPSGQGKTTSIIIGPDGTYQSDPDKYKGMNPDTTVIINSDRKRLPINSSLFSVEKKNLYTTSNIEEITVLLQQIGAGTRVKAVYIDTINGIMCDTEMLESKKLTYDKWMDLAKDIYALISLANNLRDDLVIYFSGHVTIYTDVDGNESKCLVTNGKKLEKIKLESKLPVVLYTHMERGIQGDNKYMFETQACRSTGKSPIGMFDEFIIPNSLALVDQRVREYYGIK